MSNALKVAADFGLSAGDLPDLPAEHTWVEWAAYMDRVRIYPKTFSDRLVNECSIVGKFEYNFGKSVT